MKNEAYTMEEKVVKNFEKNFKKNIEKEEKVIEKEIDGEIYIKKGVLTDKEAETKLKEVVDEIKKGRTDQETVEVLRPLFKKTIYQLETTEKKGDDY